MLPYKETIKGVGGLVFNANKTINCTRNYGRRVLPVVKSVKNVQKTRSQEFEDTRLNYVRATKDIRKNFDSLDSEGTLEPDLENIKNVYTDYKRDVRRLNDKMDADKMFRRHFRQFTEKEYSVLTWAEKEKIRFLHNSDPHEWTPEALASVFPVSPDGAEKLIKSSFRAKSLKEIEEHDLKVADRIQRIQSGEIPMTPDLEEKMKMRDQLPANFGAVGPNDQKLLIKNQLPKVIGEFASLVTPAKTRSSPPVANLPTSNESLRMLPAVINQENLDVGDSYLLKDEKTAIEELKILNIRGNERMTLREFRDNLKKAPKPPMKDSNFNEEAEYLKNIKVKEEVKPVSLSEITEAPTVEDYLNYRSIPKYKPSNHGTDQSDKMESHTKKVSQNSQFDEYHINIPQALRKPGTVYKRGQSYYDENGDFMYRVV